MAVKLGHKLDSNTICLWKMDETVFGNHTTLIDSSGNGYNLTATPTPPGIKNGRNGRKYAKWFLDYPSGTGSTHGFSGLTGNSAVITALQGEWTLCARVYIENLSSFRSIICFRGAATESEAENYQMRMAVSTSGQLDSLWEFGGGSDVQVTETTGTVTAGTWVDLAIRKKFESGTYTVSLFTGGLHRKTQTGLQNATGGTSGELRLGVDVTLEYTGAVEQVALYTTTLTDDEIAEIAVDDEFPLMTGQTLFLYKCQENPDLADSTLTGHHLQKSGGVLLVDPSPMCVPSKEFTGSDAVAYTRDDLVSTFLGNWTMEMWIKMRYPWPSRANLFGFWSEGSTGTTQSRNALASVAIDAEFKVRFFGEFGSGSNISVVTTDAVFEGTQQYKQVHVAVVKENTTAGICDVRIYIDAVLKHTFTGITRPDGGDSSLAQLELGDSNIYEAGSSDNFDGYVGDSRLSNVVRTQDEITESYERGLCFEPPRVERADVWAADLIELVFNKEVAIDSVLTSVNSYTVTKDDADALSITIKEVKPLGSDTASSVFLVVTKFTIGATYTITVDTNVVDADGIRLSRFDTKASFVGRRTKIDATVDGRPALYNMQPDGELRNILNAIMRQDDLLGGDRSDDLP